MNELERIVAKEGLKMKTRRKWEEVALKILSQARLETTSAISCALEDIEPFKGV